MILRSDLPAEQLQETFNRSFDLFDQWLDTLAYLSNVPKDALEKVFSGNMQALAAALLQDAEDCHGKAFIKGLYRERRNEDH